MVIRQTELPQECFDLCIFSVQRFRQECELVSRQLLFTAGTECLAGTFSPLTDGRDLLRPGAHIVGWVLV